MIIVKLRRRSPVGVLLTPLPRQFARDDVKLNHLHTADDFKRIFDPDLFPDEHTMQVVDAGYRCVPESDDNVSFFKSTLSRWTVRFDPGHENSLVVREFMVPHQSGMDRGVLAGQSQITSTDFPVPYQPSSDKLCGVGSNRKAESLRRQDDRRVDSDNLPGRVDKRAAGIPGVQCSIGLNYIIH